LHRFLLMYPQYQGRDFWISGESYGGHYVPNLAVAIQDANAAGETPRINLVGFQVGNAWTNAAIDNAGSVFMWWSHALISDDTYTVAMKNCDFAHIGPLSSSKSSLRQRDACQSALNDANAAMNLVNIYQLYAPVCLRPDGDGMQLMRLINKARRAPLYPVASHGSRQSDVNDPDPDPCIEQHLTNYLNRFDVQVAIHANLSASTPVTWNMCSRALNYSYTDLLRSMLPVYQRLLTSSPPLRMLVYSGDIDGIVPITGTRNWLSTLNMTVAEPWRKWVCDGQTGGWTVRYEGLTFASVREAGHMVPWTQPRRSFAVFSRFLQNQPL